MKNFFWGLVIIGGVFGVLVPGFYFNASSNLPSPLANRQQLLLLMRMQVESERMKVALGLPPKERGFVNWPDPELSRFPADFTALFLSQNGCASFLRAAPEKKSRWAVRVLRAAWGLGGDAGVAGRCKLLFASSIATRLGVTGTLETALATYRVGNLLDHQELVAWELTTVHFENGLVGVDQVLSRLYKRPLAEMNLAELAEAVLVAPPNAYLDEIRHCKNPPLIRRARDTVLQQFAADGLVTEAQSNAAQQADVACMGR
ncbi:MAG: hypothetical protein RL653_4444 [Pseudomonadota bacterium]